MRKDDSFSIIKQDKKGRIPTLPFLNMKDTILGKKYELSIAFVDTKTSRKLNREYREKNKPTNVLSFSLSKNSGELVLCPVVIKKEAPKFEMSYSSFFGFLVIHGMLHLKGMAHGSTMERKEALFKKKFGILS